NGIHKDGARIPENIEYNVLTNYTPNFDKFEFYKPLIESEIEETQTYKITTKVTVKGSLEADKTIAKSGDIVKLIFTTDDNSILTEATVNGVSIMDKLTAIGGIYYIRNVQSDLEIKAFYKEIESTVVEREK